MATKFNSIRNILSRTIDSSHARISNGINPQSIQLIIGLGNPDLKYKNTYHNVGHLFFDFIKNNMLPRYTSIRSLGMKHTYHLLKSDVFMNASGTFVQRALKQYKLKPKHLLIVHDDSDLLLGTYKLQFERGAAGHHGIDSIMTALHTAAFWRLRIGIRPPFRHRIRLPASAFVLKPVSHAHHELLLKTFKRITEEVFASVQN